MVDSSIRQLVPADAETFLALRQRALTDHPDIYTSTAEEWNVPLAHAIERIASNVVLGAFIDGRLIGVVMLALIARRSTKQRHKTEIWSVYIAPEHRGKGLAKALMLTAIEEAKRLGFMAIVLTVAEGNNDALKLYEKLGFVHFGTELGAIRLPETGRLIANHMLQLDLR